MFSHRKTVKELLFDIDEKDIVINVIKPKYDLKDLEELEKQELDKENDEYEREIQSTQLHYASTNNIKKVKPKHILNDPLKRKRYDTILSLIEKWQSREKLKAHSGLLLDDQIIHSSILTYLEIVDRVIFREEKMTVCMATIIYLELISANIPKSITMVSEYTGLKKTGISQGRKLLTDLIDKRLADLSVDQNSKDKLILIRDRLFKLKSDEDTVYDNIKKFISSTCDDLFIKGTIDNSESEEQKQKELSETCKTIVHEMYDFIEQEDLLHNQKPLTKAIAYILYLVNETTLQPNAIVYENLYKKNVTSRKLYKFILVSPSVNNKFDEILKKYNL